MSPITSWWPAPPWTATRSRNGTTFTFGAML
uniref:Uncharacterized protein n=1 Tax=Anguilla anguilla TaxID=7936 RepID=A0A0E9T8R9_ANGAN